MNSMMLLLNCLIYIALSGAVSFVLGRILPKRIFHPDRFPYRTLKVEKEGKLYLKININHWQSVLPDMSRILPGLMPAKRIMHRPTDAQLVCMIRETCVAEFIHVLLCVSGAALIWIWPGLGGVLVYALYVLLGNVPFILIQRYNRPRLIAILQASRRKAERCRNKRTQAQKKVLILSCNTGEGHNSCARAVKEAFDERNMDCSITDALSFIAPSISNLISRLHVWVYRKHPRLFRFGYRFSEKHPELFNERSFMYKLLVYGCDPLASFIIDEGYDIVISTHVFSALMLTVSCKRHHLNVRTGFVATDYTRSPSMERSNLDFYFVPDASLKRDFIINAITEDRIVDSGIPVKQALYHHTEKVFAKRNYQLPDDCRHLLVMCGSMGCGPLKWLIALIALELKENQYVTVVCGTNEKLRQKLEKRYSNNDHVRIYGYRQDISLLMDSADLYMTKPGGLSVTEAAVNHLPMVMINAVAGCEEYNKNFYVKSGLGVTSDSIWSLSRLCMDILSDEDSLAQMRASGQRKKWRNAAHVICRTMLDEPEENTDADAQNICHE